MVYLILLETERVNLGESSRGNDYGMGDGKGGRRVGWVQSGSFERESGNGVATGKLVKFWMRNRAEHDHISPAY